MKARIVLKSVITLILVAVCSYFVEVRLHRDGVPNRDLILISNIFVGLVAGLLAYVLAVREQQRQDYVEKRLRVISDMNHHIRNALQVISFYTSEDKEKQAAMSDAVERIQWALREVLPQLPAPGVESDAPKTVTAATRKSATASPRA